ncbi:hypothetical protein [Dictyobacter formicarum]|uniref:Uncharacterized protein n=1 Tax=Dictyobacter formicarum TaxID=2778368 RepID=A0ABQ3VPH0_9CHLR|nr:hypothetical protein [Dictyobacter formicarum]GHO87705.1 hypothetical protein KSZ_57110 [Dictyobacter formicarum]
MERYYWDYAPGNGFAISTESSIQEVLNQAYKQFTAPGYTVYISKDRLYGGTTFVVLFETAPNEKSKQQYYVKLANLQQYESFMRQWAVLLPTIYLQLQPLIDKSVSEGHAFRAYGPLTLRACGAPVRGRFASHGHRFQTHSCTRDADGGRITLTYLYLYAIVCSILHYICHEFINKSSSFSFFQTPVYILLM